MQLRAPRWMAVVAVLALVVGACGDSSSVEAESDTDHEVLASDSEETHDQAEGDHDDGQDGHDGADHSEEAFDFGSPAESSEADRTIEVDATDGLAFGPNAFEVSAGETIQFVITNTGVIPHDFTLGDEEAQEAHEEEMAQGGMEHSDPNAVLLQPGETKTLTWKFTETGTVLIGCHQPGHYAGGMTASIDVTA